MIGEYVYRIYPTARGFIQDSDGTVREATPDELRDYGNRLAKAMAKSMIRSVQSSKPVMAARVIEKKRGYR